jgi:hypothetical protein
MDYGFQDRRLMPRTATMGCKAVVLPFAATLSFKPRHTTPKANKIRSFDVMR